MKRKVVISIFIVIIAILCHSNKSIALTQEIKNDKLWLYFMPTDQDMDEITNNNGEDTEKEVVDLSELPIETQNEINNNAIDEKDFEYSDEDCRYDILGYVVDGWKSTTFSNTGYTTFLKVNNEKPIQIDFNNSTINSIQNDINCTFVNNGNFVKVEYILKNIGNTNATISLGTQADVQISADDFATLTRMDNNRGVNLIDERNNIQFKFYGRGVDGVTDIDHLWIGTFPEHEEHFFANNNINKIENVDSAFTFSWIDRIIKPNETQKYSILIGIGEMTSVPVVELDEQPKSFSNPNNIIITGNVQDADDESKAVIHYILDNNEEKNSSEYSLANHRYNFEINLSNENLSEGTHHIKVWAIDNQGNISNFADKDFTVSPILAPTLNMNESWSKEDVKFTISDVQTNIEKVSKYQYKIDNGDWQDINLNTEQLALSTTGTAVVYVKAVGKNYGEESNVVNKTAKVDKTKPITALSIRNKLIYINASDAHSGLNYVEYLFDTKKDSSAEDTYLKYISPISETASKDEKYYLHIKAYDKVNNISEFIKEFDVPVVATIECNETFKNSEPNFKLIDNNNQDKSIFEFYVRINNGEWKLSSIETLYSIKDPIEGTNIIETKTTDIFGRESSINKKTFTYTKTVENKVSNTVNNTINNTTNNTINNTTNIVNNTVDKNESNTINVVSKDNTVAKKILPKTGTEKAIGILLISSLVSLFIYGKYIKFS